MRLRYLYVFVTLIGFVGLLASPAGASAQNPGADEAAFATRVNAERTSRGLSRLPAASDLIVVARRHAAEMARRGQIGHYGNLRQEVQDWDEVGENVGVGPSVDDVHGALMASPSHRDEILHPGYTDIGIGVVWSGGRLWMSEIFRRRTGAAPAPAPAAAPSPEPVRRTAALTRGARSASAPRPSVATRPARPAPQVVAYLEAMAGAERELVAAYWRAMADASRRRPPPTGDRLEAGAPASPAVTLAPRRLAAAAPEEPSTTSRVAGALVLAGAGLAGLGLRRRARR